MANDGPNEVPDAIGVHVGENATRVFLKKIRIGTLDAEDETLDILDESGDARIR